MSTLKLTGSASGSTSLKAPASASDRTITFPNNAGTVLTNATPGCILQVKQNSTITDRGTITLTSGGTFYDWPNMNVAITPQNANSKILISLSAMGEGDDPDHNFRWRLKKTIDSVDSYIHGVNGGTNRTSVMGMVTTSYFDNNNASTHTMFGCSNYLDSPATTSEITYTLQLNSAGDNHVWNYNRSTDDTNSSGYERGMSYITVMEVAG